MWDTIQPIFKLFIISYLFGSLLVGRWLEFFPALMVMLAIVAFPFVVFFGFVGLLLLFAKVFKISTGRFSFIGQNPFSRFRYSYAGGSSNNYFNDENTFEHESYEHTSDSSSASFKEEEKFNPYQILGIQPGVSKDKIKSAYKEQMKLYHPDRVNHLGSDLKELANQKTKDIQRAYEYLYG